MIRPECFESCDIVFARLIDEDIFEVCKLFQTDCQSCSWMTQELSLLLRISPENHRLTDWFPQVVELDDLPDVVDNLGVVHGEPLGHL